MDLARLVVRVEGRSMTFCGTVHKDLMTVTHVIDQSRGKMFSFRHDRFMGKNPKEPFECSDRRKILQAARRKYGIATSLCFENYRCTIGMKTDADGDNPITLIDLRNNQDILQGFAEKHWEISV